MIVLGIVLGVLFAGLKAHDYLTDGASIRRAPVGAADNCPTPPLCDNRSTCLGGCKMVRR